VGFFEVAKFPNDASNGDSKNGTYYTSVECEDKGGTKDGNCASGFDVYCVMLRVDLVLLAFVVSTPVNTCMSTHLALFAII